MSEEIIYKKCLDCDGAGCEKCHEYGCLNRELWFAENEKSIRHPIRTGAKLINFITDIRGWRQEWDRFLPEDQINIIRNFESIIRAENHVSRIKENE